MTRLRWFGYVRRKEHILRRTLNLEVEGRRPLGRPKKTWRKKEGRREMRERRRREEVLSRKAKREEG